MDVEHRAKERPHPAESVVTLLDKIKDDASLRTAVRWEDDNKVRDGVLKRGRDEIVKYASQWRVDAGNIEEATAEMINACGWYTTIAWRKMINSDSLLYRGSPKSPQTDQFRLLLYARAQQLHLFLHIPKTALDQYCNQGEVTKLTRKARSMSIRCERLAPPFSWMRSLDMYRSIHTQAGMTSLRERGILKTMVMLARWFGRWCMENVYAYPMKTTPNSTSKAKCGCNLQIWVSRTTTQIK